MKTFKQLFLLFVSVFFLWSNVLGQIIAIQDFESSPTTPTMTYTGGVASSGNGSYPSTNMFVSGSAGRKVNNSGVDIVFSTIDASACSAISFTVRLASFSGTSGNGADDTDIVSVYVSTDGGTTYSKEMQIGGGTNLRWDFSNTGIASAVYDGNNTVEAAKTFTTANSTLSLTGLPNSSSLRIKLNLVNNNSNEIWVIDDAQILGTCSVSSPILTNQSFTGTVSTAFSETPSNTGGAATSWSVVSGTLPAGLSLNTSTGEISGTPTAFGTTSVDIKATNASGSSTATYTFTIANYPPPILNDQSFTGTVSIAFSQTPTNSGNPATSWSVVSGTLPTGLSLNTSTGAITGTPTAFGTTSVDIQATNVGGSSTATYTFTIANYPPPILNDQSFTGTVSIAFSQTPTNSGNPATSWAVVSGTLPAGLSLNASTGEISGTPTAAGTTSVDIQATNVGGSSTATYTFTISAAPVGTSCYTANGPDGSASGSTSTGDTDSGGTPTSTIRLASGSSGGSISFSSTGVTTSDILLRFRAKGWSASETEVKVTVDGQDVTYTTLSTTFGWIEIPFSGVGINPTIVFSCVKNKRAHIGNIEIVCLAPPSCTPTITLTEVRPTSAPVEANVQLEVNDASLITQVQLDGSSLAYTVLNATTIEVTIPSGTTEGTHTIQLIEASSCQTDVSFDVTVNSGSCNLLPPTYNDLFISEVYDSGSGNGFVIELYNPTSSPISLDNYSIQINNNAGGTNFHGGSGGSGCDANTDLKDIVVQAFSTVVINLGSNKECSSAYSYDRDKGKGGINADDDIKLLKNCSLVDIAHAPNNDGYSLKRNIISGETVPTATYTATQWDINSTESCADLGSFVVPPILIDVTSPVDVSGCTVDVTVSSTTPGVTYQWYYNDPATMTTWKEVNSTNLPGVTITGNTSDHLTISGATSGLDGYQFYAAVIDGTCSKASGAAQFTFGSNPIYRSKASGDWTDISNWEVAATVSGPWSAACDYPTAANSDKVFISNGTNIVLDIDNDIDYLEIKNGGTLETLPTSQLTVYDSNAGADFIVDGTFLYRSGSVNSLTFDSGVTWSLGGAATLTKTNNGNASIFRDNYEGGIATIPATAQWIYRYNGDGDPTTVTVNMYYPNLRFENTTAASYNTIALSSFDGNLGTTVVKGNLEVGTTGASDYILHHNNSNATPILVMGNLTIGGISQITNEAVTAGHEGTGIELKGNLTVDGTLDITHGSTERILKFSGTSDQSVSGVGTGSIQLYKIETNKATGNVLLNRNLQAQNELKMVQGNILTTTKLLELGRNTSQKGILTYTDGFVIGKMKRWFNGANPSNIISSTFPMGWEDGGVKNRFADIAFAVAPIAGGSLTTEFIPDDMTYNGLVISAANSGGFGSNIVNAEDQGYWTISAADGLDGGTYASSLTGEGFTQIVDLADITELKRSNSAAPWTAPGSHQPTTGTLLKPTVHRSGLSGFSDFGFGTRNDAHPLPIELLSFDVNCVEGNTILSWETATETNNDYFTVEVSTDGIHWTKIGEVRGNGNSVELNSYEINYLNAIDQVLYYRLSQTDFDGETEQFMPISAYCVSKEKGMLVFPIPATEQLTVQIQGYESENAVISLVNVEGKTLKEEQMGKTQGSIVLDVHSLAAGIYFVRLKTAEGEMISEKVEIRK